MNKKGLFICMLTLAALAFLAYAWTPDPNLIDLTTIQPVLKQLLDFICWPICLIIYIASGIAALLLILTGARYVAADDPGTRSELRHYMTTIIVGLMIVLIAIPVINFVISDLLPSVSCECITAPVENINTVFCNLINALSTIGPWLCALVVVYGGLRYLASADDPGARKAAKTTIIAAFVGLVVVMLAIPLVNMVLGDALKAVECESSTNDFTEQIVSILCNFLYILALICPPICALVATYGGLRYITSADDPGARDTAKTIIISALIGMILVMLAVPLVNVVVNSSTPVDYAKCTLQGTVTEEITRIMCNFICFLSYIAPAVCGLVVIYGGLRYLVSGEDPGARRTSKTIIISAFVGMVLVFIAVPIVNMVLTSMFGQVGCDCPDSQSVKDVVNILCKFICLIASVSPAIAALVMIYGGLRYVTSAEDPGARGAAKTIVISAIVGLILVMISLAMVNLVVSGWAKDVQCGCFNVNPVEEINRVLCNLVCTVQMIIPSVAALVLIYGGFKYVTSAEDPGARAAARSIIINGIIGLVIVFLAVQVINIVISGLVPTFKCDCAQLFPQIFGQLGIAAGDSKNPGGGSADPLLHVLSSDAICTNCCRENIDTECYYSFESGGNSQYGGYSSTTGQKITKCVPPTGSGTYTIEWSEGGSVVPLNPVAGAKCSTKAEAMPCTSAADAPAKGPTFVYDSVKKDCVNKCAAGQKCCQTTDSSGHPGCIGTDTPNVIKMFSCLGDVKTTYSCKNDICDPTVAFCDPICPNIYTCSSAQPDPGDLGLANPAIN
jgi:hypothetical protein